MGRSSVIGMSVLMLVMFITAPCVYSQENETTAAGAPEASMEMQAQNAEPAQPQSTEEPGSGNLEMKEESVSPMVPGEKDLSIYGEVQNINAGTSSITVQYYDYDSDAEKTIEIFSGPNTKIENAAAILDIKAGEWVDVTYVLKDTKCVARVITVEKEEEVSEGTGVDADIAETE